MQSLKSRHSDFKFGSWPFSSPPRELPAYTAQYLKHSEQQVSGPHWANRSLRPRGKGTWPRSHREPGAAPRFGPQVFASPLPLPLPLSLPLLPRARPLTSTPRGPGLGSGHSRLGEKGTRPSGLPEDAQEAEQKMLQLPEQQSLSVVPPRAFRERSHAAGRSALPSGPAAPPRLTCSPS